MVNATSDPRSYRSDDTHTVQAGSQAGQAAARAAYIESLLAHWPAPTPQQQRTVSHLLANATPAVSVADWVKWENKRYIEATETPGTHGTYGDEVAA